MQQGLKHRLIGAIVFLAIASIIFPLFVHKRHTTVVPALVKRAIPAPPKMLAPVVAAQPASTYVREALAPPKAWVLQVGSFSSQRNATAWFRRLSALGLDAYTRRVVGDQGAVSLKVFVGPVVAHDKIVAIKRRVAQQYHINGIIRKYHQ